MKLRKMRAASLVAANAKSIKIGQTDSLGFSYYIG